MKEHPSMPVPILGNDHPKTPDSGGTGVYLVPGSAATINLDSNREQHWRDLDSFFAKNEVEIQKAQRSPLGSDKISDVGVAIDTFTETANVVLQGLTALANVHPALGIAIFAFHGIIQLNLTRRDNDRKVIAVKVEMQTMMCAMFQFRELRHVHLSEDHRNIENSRLQRLIQRITDEIKACGSDLDYYTERGSVSRVISSKTYEKRFANHVKTFAQRRSELQSVVTVYTAQGVDAANIGILSIGERINVVDDKLDSILAIFDKLNTARERDLLQFVKEKGGEDKCIDDDRLLTRLLAMAGESKKAPTSGFDAREQDQQLIDVRKELKNDRRNLEAILDQNLSRFESILQMQSSRIEDNSSKLDTITMLLVDQGKVIERVVSSRKATVTTLEDPVLREMWDRMGFRGKGSVKAKTFILNFRDYLSMDDRTPAASAYGSPIPTIAELPPVEGSEDGTKSEPESATYSQVVTNQFLKAELKDEWALQYLTVSYVHPIIEAIDEDCSGFISVKEANRFAQARPHGRSLISWMAYWATGWHINLTQYKKQIYSTIIQMHQLSITALPANKQLIRTYLNSFKLVYVEALLRSIKSLPADSGIEEDQVLAEYAKSIATTQELQLTRNFEVINYVLRSESDVKIVAGSGKKRVETWILPVLHILLKRHLDVIILAQKEIIHAHEMVVHEGSLGVIFNTFEDRLHRLEAIFQQVYRGNLEPHFEVFAYGMFQALFKNLQHAPADSTLHLEEWTQYYQIKDILAAKLADAPPDKAILAEGPAKEYVCEDVSQVPPSLAPPGGFVDASIDATGADSKPHPLEGVWSCTFRSRMPFSMTIKLVRDGKIQGELGSVVSKGYITGDYKTEEGMTPGVFLDVEAALSFVDGHEETRVCSANYDPDREVITGTWKEKSAMDSENNFGSIPEIFVARRTPIHLFLHRDVIDSPDTFDASELRRRRWRFAIDAIRSQTKARVNSKEGVVSRLKGRNSLIKMHYQSYANGAQGLIYETGTYLQTTLTHGTPNTLEAHSLYQYLAKYRSDRLMDDCNTRTITCDSCSTRITHVRYHCITCTTEKYNNEVDLCEKCRDMDGVNSINRANNFLHRTSHSLLRATSTTWIKKHELAWLIPDARLASEKVKARFRELTTGSSRNSSTGGGKGAADLGASSTLKSSTPPNCIFCQEPILALPAWICTLCGETELMCMDCVKSKKQADTEEHVLLRIFDDVRVWPNEASGMSKAVADELSSLRDGLETRIKTLESRVDTQLAEILSMVTKLVQGSQSQSRTVTAAP